MWTLSAPELDELFDDDPTVGGAFYHQQLSTAKKNFEKRDNAYPGRYLCPIHHGLEHGPKTVGLQSPCARWFCHCRPARHVKRNGSIVRKETSGGWGGQGGRLLRRHDHTRLIALLLHALPAGTGREVRGCVYNNMASNPRNVGGFGKGDCRDGTVPPASGAYTGLIEKGDCEDVGYLGWKM